MWSSVAELELLSTFPPSSCGNLNPTFPTMGLYAQKWTGEKSLQTPGKVQIPLDVPPKLDSGSKQMSFIMHPQPLSSDKHALFICTHETSVNSVLYLKGYFQKKYAGRSMHATHSKCREISGLMILSCTVGVERSGQAEGP